ncbi:MAG: hypothetical protein ACRBDI_04640 [Alphaproteobacteria bacterium]
MTEQNEEAIKTPFWGGKLSFLNSLTFVHSKIFQIIFLVFCIFMIGYLDSQIYGYTNSTIAYSLTPTIAGFTGWLLKRKNGVPFSKAFLGYSSIFAFVMMTFKILESLY